MDWVLATLHVTSGSCNRDKFRPNLLLVSSLDTTFYVLHLFTKNQKNCKSFSLRKTKRHLKKSVKLVKLY